MAYSLDSIECLVKMNLDMNIRVTDSPQLVIMNKWSLSPVIYVEYPYPMQKKCPLRQKLPVISHLLSQKVNIIVLRI